MSMRRMMPFTIVVLLLMQTLAMNLVVPAEAASGRGVAAVRRVLSGEELRCRNGRCGFHGVGGNGDGDDLFSVVIFVPVVIRKIGNGSNDQAA